MIPQNPASSTQSWTLWCVLGCLVHESTFTFFDKLCLTLPGVGSVNLFDGFLLLILFETIRLYTCCPIGFEERLLAFLIAAWFLTSGLFNVIMDVVSPQIFLRHTVRLTLAWCIFPVVWHMRQEDRRLLLKALYVVAFAVCSLHLYILLAGRSDLITSWYYGYSRSKANPNYHLLLRRLDSGYITAWPGGGLLMSCLLVAGLWEIFTTDSLQKRLLWIVAAITACIAIIVSISRARILVCFVAAPILVAIKLRRRLGSFLITGVATTCATLLVAQLVMTHNPELRQRQDEKWATFGNEFDAFESIRLQDNAAALREFGDVWSFGKTSLQLADPTTPFGSDVHGVLSLILYGGLPLALLSLGFLLRTTLAGQGIKAQFAEWHVLVSIFLLWLSNTEPLFFSTRTLVPFLVFAGAICAQYKDQQQISRHIPYAG